MKSAPKKSSKTTKEEVGSAAAQTPVSNEPELQPKPSVPEAKEDAPSGAIVPEESATLPPEDKPLAPEVKKEVEVEVIADYSGTPPQGASATVDAPSQTEESKIEISKEETPDADVVKKPETVVEEDKEEPEVEAEKDKSVEDKEETEPASAKSSSEARNEPKPQKKSFFYPDEAKGEDAPTVRSKELHPDVPTVDQNADLKIENAKAKEENVPDIDKDSSLKVESVKEADEEAPATRVCCTWMRWRRRKLIPRENWNCRYMQLATDM